MVAMPKKLPEKRRGVAVQARLDDDLAAAFDAFVKSQRIPPSVADVLVVAVQELLQREGFWPPKPTKNG